VGAPICFRRPTAFVQPCAVCANGPQSHAQPNGSKESPRVRACACVRAPWLLHAKCAVCVCVCRPGGGGRLWIACLVRLHDPTDVAAEGNAVPRFARMCTPMQGPCRQACGAVRCSQHAPSHRRRASGEVRGHRAPRGSCALWCLAVHCRPVGADGQCDAAVRVGTAARRASARRLCATGCRVRAAPTWAAVPYSCRPSRRATGSCCKHTAACELSQAANYRV
jgi:hypothetical protein